MLLRPPFLTEDLICLLCMKCVLIEAAAFKVQRMICTKTFFFPSCSAYNPCIIEGAHVLCCKKAFGSVEVYRAKYKDRTYFILLYLPLGWWGL